MPDNVPSEAPPSYATATGSSTAGGSSNNDSSHLTVPGQSGGKNLTLSQRRSMEDEGRELPSGWVRTFDPESHHQFFVDTTKEPPRSIWHHPYDDEEYLATLSSEERERLEAEGEPYRTQSHKDEYLAAHSEDDEAHHPSAGSSSGASGSAELPPRPQGKGKAPEERSFGRKIKDKVTGMTHEERVQERKKRAEQEQRMYEQHRKIRQAMAQAAQTGQAVKLGVDNTGREVWVEPPSRGAGYGGYGASAYRYDPYGSMGTYTTPNARYIRPVQPYGRPMYCSGYGYPYRSGFGGAGLGLGAGAGLGLLAGGLLF